jgi:imidazolonepropionase-like amidohydrolase
MQMAVSFACSQRDLSPAEAICAAANGTCALALGHRTGSLEPGNVADLLLKVTDYREVAKPVGINRVPMVLKNRRANYQEGEVTGWTTQ